MKQNRVVGLAIAGALFLLPLSATMAIVIYQAWWHANYYVVEHTDYNESERRADAELVDDKLEDKIPKFDPDLVDSQPLGKWQVNQSAAVIKLDCPDIKPDVEEELLELRPSYADALKTAKYKGFDVLPSANMLDGAAKQFDDGLYATLDRACFRGELDFAPSAPNVIQSVLEKLPPDSPAAAFLAAALELADVKSDLPNEQTVAVKRWMDAFKNDESRSKPIAFYNWTPELQQVWRFFKFLQYEFNDDKADVPRAVAAVLRDDPELLEQYRAINAFYGRLTNPVICLPVDALIDTEQSIAEVAKSHGARHVTTAIFPPSTTRETELFDRMFGSGLPPGANLMSELIRRIRTGEVDLAPNDESGWYQYQAYALETFLLPSKGQEDEKLLLTAKYKRRLLEAFEAMITKRRETHSRAPFVTAAAEAPPSEVKPRLRIEPCATFYLRTARAYAFLQNFLLGTVGEKRLSELYGLRKDGNRDDNLHAELSSIRDRFYGFYFIACEDIGMRPQLLEDEPVDVDSAKQTALDWLANIGGNADLACDTRVSVPIYFDVRQNKTRLWATLGVRLAKLEASYARPPKIRPLDEEGEWQDVESFRLEESRYVIPVDEFAEFEISGLTALTREELRKVCDRYRFKDEIIYDLQRD